MINTEAMTSLFGGTRVMDKPVRPAERPGRSPEGTSPTLRRTCGNYVAPWSGGDDPTQPPAIDWPCQQWMVPAGGADKRRARRRFGCLGGGYFFTVRIQVLAV